MEKDSKSQKYLLTINNPKEKRWSHEKIKETLLTKFKTFEYACMSDECGSTYHTHCFVTFTSRVRFSMIKKHFPEAHIDIAKGTITDNINYVSKKGKWEDTDKSETRIEGTLEEFGSRPSESRGLRQDMTELYEMVLDGMSNAQILSTNQDYIMQIDKLDKLRTTILMEKYENDIRNVHVTYISGKTGTGKTSGVLKKHGASNVYRVTDYKHPFDGYKCQPVICFDEFQSALGIEMMRNYCDIYPIELPARYANKFACYTEIYIISNWSLEMQYEHEQKISKDSWEAFLRRINQVIIYNSQTDIITYNSVQEYFNRKEAFHQLSEDEKAEVPFNSPCGG